MNEILVSESKTLKLTNVLSRRIMPEDFANINLIVTQMENFVRSHGAQPIGPLVQHICIAKGPKPEPQMYLLRQANQLITRLDPQYHMDAVLRSARTTTRALWTSLWRRNKPMTNVHVTNLYDLQDRRIMMEKKLPPYGYALLLIVAALMIGLVAWSTVTPRIYISQLQGTVQSANKTYIMSSYSGQITELTISEGSYVEQGDLIAKSTDIDIQQSQLENQLAIYQTQLAQYNKLIQSIQDNTNYFSESDPADQTYYYQYENYQSQVAQHTFDSSAYRAAGYSEAQIQSMMEQNQSELEQAACRPILKTSSPSWTL